MYTEDLDPLFHLFRLERSKKGPKKASFLPPLLLAFWGGPFLAILTPDLVADFVRFCRFWVADFCRSADLGQSDRSEPTDRQTDPIWSPKLGSKIPILGSNRVVSLQADFKVSVFSENLVDLRLHFPDFRDPILYTPINRPVRTPDLARFGQIWRSDRSI